MKLFAKREDIRSLFIGFITFILGGIQTAAAARCHNVPRRGVNSGWEIFRHWAIHVRMDYDK